VPVGGANPEFGEALAVESVGDHEIRYFLEIEYISHYGEWFSPFCWRWFAFSCDFVFLIFGESLLSFLI